MKHKQLETSTTTTDLGHFSAIAAAYTVDRVGDRIVPGAFDKTIGAWQNSGKRIPLHWDHSGDAKNIIGWVDPSSMRETDAGLYVEGQLDLEHSETAREAWRSMKNSAVALSFGYLAEEKKSADGVNELIEIDLFEISVVPGPANPDTRFLSLKSVQAVEETTVEESNEEPEEANSQEEEPQTAKSAPQDPLYKESMDLLYAIAKGRPISPS